MLLPALSNASRGATPMHKKKKGPSEPGGEEVEELNFIVRAALKSEKCTVDFFMFHLLGRLKGGLISAACSIGPGGGPNMGWGLNLGGGGAD